MQKKPRLKSYLAVAAFFALGLMAKPMVVTLPFVLLLLDYWPLERFRKSMPAQTIRKEENNPVPARKKKGKPAKQTQKATVELQKPAIYEFEWALVRPLVLEKIPLFALTILSCAATYIAQKTGGAFAPIDIYTLDIRTANALVSYILYITKMIWPDNLAVFYPHPGPWPFWEVLGAVLILVAVTFAVIRLAKRFPYLPVGWLWFTGTLVPVIGIVQVGGQGLADRYTYIPSIGLFIMTAWGVPELFRNRRYARMALAASSALCLLCFSILTWTQVGYWRDNTTLFDHTLNVTENNYWLYNNRGNARDNLGNHAQAIEDFDRALEINPRYAEAYSNRGIAYNALGNYSRAVEDFDRAIEFKPDYAKAYNNRGAAYMALGNSSRAIENLDRAVALDPNYTEAYYNRGILYHNLGEYRQAIDDYDKAVASDNFKKPEVFCNRGAAYDSLGDHMRAIEDYDRAISINPRHAKAYFNRAMAYGQLGDTMKSIKDYDRAIAIIPEYPKAYFNRGVAYGSLGNKNQEVEDISTAAKLGYEDAKNYLKSRGINW